MGDARRQGGSRMMMMDLFGVNVMTIIISTIMMMIMMVMIISMLMIVMNIEQQGIAAPVVNSETGLTTRQFAGDNDYNYNDINDIDNDLNDNDTDLNDDNNDLVDNDNNNN